MTKSEQLGCSTNIPAEVDDGLKICYIFKKYDKKIKAEIEYRWIKEFPRHDNGKQKRYCLFGVNKMLFF